FAPSTGRVGQDEGRLENLACCDRPMIGGTLGEADFLQGPDEQGDPTQCGERTEDDRREDFYHGATICLRVLLIPSYFPFNRLNRSSTLLAVSTASPSPP